MVQEGTPVQKLVKICSNSFWCPNTADMHPFSHLHSAHGRREPITFFGAHPNAVRYVVFLCSKVADSFRQVREGSTQ